jgi:hypothetical protein
VEIDQVADVDSVLVRQRHGVALRAPGRPCPVK